MTQTPAERVGKHKWVHEPDTNEANGIPKRAKFCDYCGKIDIYIGKRYDASCPGWNVGP